MEQSSAKPYTERLPQYIWAITQRFIALVCLIVMAPVMAIIAIAINLESKGPVIFRQQRPGYQGVEFTALKFRSMTLGSEAVTALGVQGTDPRITRVGRVLRLSKLDELPQLWNIVRGDMRFVGPRPIPHALNEVLCDQVHGFQQRYAVRPGLTSLAQVCIADNGLDHRLVQDWSTRFEAERRYKRNRSVSYDLIVIMLTVLYIIK